MRCRHVRTRLVAFQDEELAPGEAQQVVDHLARCGDCRQLERRLDGVTPQARLVVPADVRARLHARVDGPVLRRVAASRPQPRRSVLAGWLAWFRRETEVPMGALLAYGLVLAGVLAWGLSNWWTLEHLEARLDAHQTAAAGAPEAPTQIPAEQYRPASWTPEEDGDYH